MRSSAFILAAGHGSRLMPLTKYRPKPLTPICGVSLLEYSLALCAKHELKHVVVNAHHLAQQVAKQAPELGRRWGVEVTVLIEEGEILGTGGGMRRAMDLMTDPFVVLNGDILCDAQLTELLQACKPALGCLLLRSSPDAASKGIVAVDELGRLVKLRSIARMEGVEPARLDTHFTGIHAITLEGLSHVPSTGYACVARTAYRDLVPQGVIAGLHHEGIWVDVGNPEIYLETNMAVLRGELVPPINPAERAQSWEPERKILIGKGAQLGAGVSLIENVIIGEGAHICDGAQLSDVVVWDGATAPGERLHRAIVHDGGVLQL